MTSTESPYVELMLRLGGLGCSEQALASLTDREQMALAAYHEGWSRPNQVLPPDSEWDLYAFIGARRTGKTWPLSRYVCEMAASGEAMRILLIAQSLKKARAIFATGASGMLQQPPWLRPVRKGDTLLWASGAVASITSAAPTEKSEERGDEYDLLWASEVTAWARGCRLDVWRNARLSTSSGSAKVVVDATPKRGNPIVKEIKTEAEHNSRVRWVRYRVEENRYNLARGYVESMRRALAGTRSEREELDGLEADDTGGLIHDDWIEAGRRDAPATWKRRIVVLDPTVADGKPTDNNAGLVHMGTGIDDQIYITKDASAIMGPEEWAKRAIEGVIADHADCLVIETNRGGRVIDFGLQLLARQYGQELRVVDLKAKTRWSPGTINVKLVHARGDKVTRFDPAVVEYHAGRVSHVKTANLERLEEVLTSWEAETANSRDSPGELDAVAWGVIELRGLHEQQKAAAKGQAAVTAAARQTAAAHRDRSPVRELRPVPRRGRSSLL